MALIPTALNQLLDALYRTVVESDDWRPFVSSLREWMGGVDIGLAPASAADFGRWRRLIPPALESLVPVSRSFDGADGAVLRAPLSLCGIDGFLVVNHKGPHDRIAIDEARLAIVADHLRRALGLRQALHHSESINAAMRKSLDSFDVGIAHIDMEAVVLQRNASFERLVLGSAATIADGRLVFRDMERQDALHAYLSDALRAHRSEDEPKLDIDTATGTYIQFRRSKIGRGPFSGGNCVFLVVAAETRRARVTPSPGLLEKHGLTTAEVRLIGALTSGQTLKKYAQEAGISIHTARSHLKKIYYKTGLSSQTGLIRYVLTGNAR